MSTRFKVRRDLACNWNNNNPILAAGEPGLEADTNKIKYGDGATAWCNLSYTGGVNVGPDGQLAIGNGASEDGSQSEGSIAIGTNAAYGGQMYGAIAIGCCAGYGGQPWQSVAVGAYAGACGQGPSTVAIGARAGQCCQNMNAIAIGRCAGGCNQGCQAVAVGRFAGRCNQTCQAVAIGACAGYEGQQCHAVAIGPEAGAYGQSNSTVAIGRHAGYCCQQFRGVAVGRCSGFLNQGQQAVAIGALAGKFNQGSYSVAIGWHAGYGNQASGAVAIGCHAGGGYGWTVPWICGDGSNCSVVVCSYSGNVPVRAGMNIVGNGFSVAAKILSVDTSTVAPDYILTLDSAPGDPPSAGSFTVDGWQGNTSIAIGTKAAEWVQHDNSIVINATGVEVNSAGTGTTVIKTVRAITTASLAGFYPSYYNPETGELVYVTP